MKVQYALLAGLVLSPMTQGLAAQGGNVGNGGRVYVCYNKPNEYGKRSIKSVELVDYIEARTLTDWKIDLGQDPDPIADNSDQMIEVALARLEKVDLWRANLVRAKIAEIKSQWKFLDLDKDAVALSKIADANVLIQPSDNKECEEQNAAFNKVNPGPKGFKYVFIDQYYKNLSDLGRAGLILHEAIYNIEAEKGATTSDGTREMVRAISSREVLDFTPMAYYDFVVQYSKILSVTAKNGSFYGTMKDPISWFNEQYVRSAYLAIDQSYPSVAVVCFYCKPKTTHSVLAISSNAKANEKLDFYMTNEMESAIITKGSSARFGMLELPIEQLRYDLSSKTLSFQKRAWHEIKSSFIHYTDGTAQEFEGKGTIDENGQINFLFLNYGNTFPYGSKSVEVTSNYSDMGLLFKVTTHRDVNHIQKLVVINLSESKINVSFVDTSGATYTAARLHSKEKNGCWLSPCNKMILKKRVAATAELDEQGKITKLYIQDIAK